MTNERFFRMLSIALLGALALACVPDSHAGAQASSTNVVEDVALVMAASVPVEIQIVAEINEINAGRFNPALTGGFETQMPPRTLTNPTEMAALTLFDPNL